MTELQSTIYVLDHLYDRIKEGVLLLTPEDACSFLQPLQEMMFMAVHEIVTIEEEKRVDNLLNDVLNPKD